MRLEKWTQPYWEWRRRLPLNSPPYWNYWQKKLKNSEITPRSGSGRTRSCQYDPPPLSKNEENCTEEILDHIEKGWQGEEWAINIPQIVNEILGQNLFAARTPPATRINHATDGIQWIRMEELGPLTNRCRAVRTLNEKRRKTQRGTIDKNTNSEQLEFECQPVGKTTVL